MTIMWVKTWLCPNSGLHPSKDPAFVAFEGESFGETFEGCVNLRIISWLRHQMFLPLPLKRRLHLWGAFRGTFELRQPLPGVMT